LVRHSKGQKPSVSYDTLRVEQADFQTHSNVYRLDTDVYLSHVGHHLSRSITSSHR
jgi:hypothetical protein